MTTQTDPIPLGIVASSSDDIPPDGRELNDKNPCSATDGAMRLGAAALHGIAGDVVSVLAPHTEADPAGLLITFLAAAGAAMGPGPHALADGSEHPARLNVVLVGKSARARKGTSWAVLRRVFARADPGFFAEHVIGGLASGEGLVAALANGLDGADPTRAGWQLVVEPEFARLLRVAARSASLSSIVREAWDSGNLSVLTRKEPLRASGVHLGILGHITSEELTSSLRAVEVSNGLANRFLFVNVQRSQRLPFGGHLDEDALDLLGAHVGRALERGRQLGELRRSPEARLKWARTYNSLDDQVSGVVGGLTARAEAQLLRLSVTYAALDGSEIIDVEHLEAAEAVWTYCDATVKQLFGAGSSQDDVAARLLAALADEPNGLDGTQQRDLFSRHASGSHLASARRDLERRGLVVTHRIETGGRPRLVTRLVPADPSPDTPTGVLWSLGSHLSQPQGQALSSHSVEQPEGVRELSGTVTSEPLQ
jgi:hypothetical protein